MRGWDRNLIGPYLALVESPEDERLRPSRRRVRDFLCGSLVSPQCV